MHGRRRRIEHEQRVKVGGRGIEHAAEKRSSTAIGGNGGCVRRVFGGDTSLIAAGVAAVPWPRETRADASTHIALSAWPSAALAMT